MKTTAGSRDGRGSGAGASGATDLGGRWAYLAASSLGRAAVGFQFQSAPAMAAPLAAGLGFSLTEIGAATGLYMLPGVVFSLAAGWALHRFGVRSTLLASLVAMAVSGALAASAEDFGRLAAARLLGGAGAAALTVAAVKGLYDRFPLAELPLANGLASGAQPFGMGCALLLFGAMGAAADWRQGFLATGAVAAAGFAATLIVVARSAPRAPAGAPRAPAGRAPRRERAGLLLAGLAIAPYAGCFYAFLSFFPAHLARHDWPPGLAGLWLGMLGWAPILAGPSGGWIAARLGRPFAMAALCMGLWGAAVVALGLTEPSRWLIATLLLTGPLPVGVMMSLPVHVVPPERRDTASGVFMAFMFGGLSVYPAVAGWVGERFGGETPVAAAIVFCGAAFMLGLVPLLALAGLARRGAGR